MTTQKCCENCGRRILYSLVAEKFDTQTCAMAYLERKSLKQLYEANQKTIHLQKAAIMKLQSDCTDYRRAIKEMRITIETYTQTLQKNKIALPEVHF